MERKFEEDVLIEAEIQRDLDKLTEADLEWSQSSNVELSNSDNSLSDDANLVEHIFFRFHVYKSVKY
jgi:iron-sulfur cluster repair protein YtfE (RIC family)